MNKEHLKVYKQAIKEVKDHEEIVTNSIYRIIWQDMILQYLVATNHDTFNLFIDRYIEDSSITEYSKRKLILKLLKDGFTLKTNEESYTLYIISKQNIERHIENIGKKDNNNEQIKMPITPAVETRRK